MDRGNFQDDNKQKQVVNTSQEKESNISNEENKIQNKIPAISNEDLKIVKDEKIILNNFNDKDVSRKQKHNSKKIFAKHLNPKNVQKKKNNTNPFLTENNAIDYKRKKNSKFDISKKSAKLSYLNNFKNDKCDISDIKDSGVNKTVFSKISESMYKITKNDKFPSKKVRNLGLEDEENYNKLTEEAFLCFCANKANKENEKIIYEFLGRKKNEEISKKIGIDSEKEKENELETFHDVRRTTILTDRNRSYVSSRTFQEFLQDQKDKEKKHENHLKTNESLHREELKAKLRDRPLLNEETIKLAKNSHRSTNVNIHSRLYQEYNDKNKKEEKNKEKKMYDKQEQKKLSKVKIKENIERLFHEYETKKKKMGEIESKQENEIRNLSSNHSTSKNSTKIIFKKFKTILENSLESINNKKIDETFEISYMDFVKLLYKINFTSKNYFLLIESKGKNEENIEIEESNERIKRTIYKKAKYENDIEYKLINDAWKIIIKSKDFKIDAQGSSKRLLLFFLSVLGIYKENIDIKEFPFMANDINNANGSSTNYSNLSKQIYKYFSLYRNNAINGLLLRDKDNKRRLEIENEMEKSLPFAPSLNKNSKGLFKYNHSSTEMHLSVQKNYEQYRKNRELKLKEKEKMLEKEEKEKCPFVPCRSKIKQKKDIMEISQRLYSTGLKNLKTSNSTPNNFLTEKTNNKTYNVEKSNNLNSNNDSIQRMFNHNPLEKDLRVKKKIKELEETRNQKSYEQLILKKGFRPKEDFKNNEGLYKFDQLSYKNGRFAHDDEPLNNFKNTFKKFERLEKKKGKREKFIFEIIVDNKPRNLIIYPDEDINYKVKVFCNVYKLTYDDKKRILQTIFHQLKRKNNF